MREVERLYQLQELDEGIALYERKIQEWAGRLQRVHQRLAEVRQAHQAGEKAAQERAARLRQTESALWEQEGLLKGLEKRLYSDTIRSEREAQAVQAQIEQVRQRKSALEDEALALMEENEQQRRVLDGLIAEEERCFQEYEALARETAAQEKGLQEQVEPLRAARAELIRTIPSAIRPLYEQARRTYGKAVVRVHDNTCEGCHLEVPLLVRKAAAGGELVRCPNCGRILLV